MSWCYLVAKFKNTWKFLELKKKKEDKYSGPDHYMKNKNYIIYSITIKCKNCFFIIRINNLSNETQDSIKSRI